MQDSSVDSEELKQSHENSSETEEDLAKSKDKEQDENLQLRKLMKKSKA